MVARPVARHARSSPAALAVGRRGSSYGRSALTSSVAGVALLSFGVGAGYVGVLVAAVAAAVLVGLGLAAARSQLARRHLGGLAARSITSCD